MHIAAAVEKRLTVNAAPTTTMVTSDLNPSIVGNLLFVSAEGGGNRKDCAKGGVADPADHTAGVRIYDVSRSDRGRALMRDITEQVDREAKSFGVQVLDVRLRRLGVLTAIGLVLFAAGFTWAAALAIGLPLGLSSTAQVLPMLRGSGLLNRRHGERAFSILLFQDLSIIPLITIVAALSVRPIRKALRST